MHIKKKKTISKKTTKNNNKRNSNRSSKTISKSMDNNTENSNKQQNIDQDLLQKATKKARLEFGINESDDISNDIYVQHRIKQIYLDLCGKPIRHQLYLKCLKRGFQILKLEYFPDNTEKNRSTLRTNTKLLLLVNQLYYNKPLVENINPKTIEQSIFFDRACREIIGKRCPTSVKGLSKLFKNTKKINKIIIRYKAIDKASKK